MSPYEDAERLMTECEHLRGLLSKQQAVVDAARALRDFENTHNTADGDGFIRREELLIAITEAVCALDGEP